MHKIRYEILKQFYKKAYQDQSVLIDGLEYDLSIIWSIIEDNNYDTISMEELMDILEGDIVKIKRDSFENIDYPILIHKNRVVDGEELLVKAIENGYKDLNVIFLDEIDLSEALME